MEDIKGWKGPVFAKDQKVGWKKLNNVRSCNQCRLRHVRCSLIDSGGPCDHCRKRRETCEVLGWEMKPCDPASFIYKYVLPPPRGPTTTPVEDESISDGIATMLHPLELTSRLEKINRRPHAQMFSWGPDEAVSSRPISAQFGENYQEHCSEDCPSRVKKESSRLIMEGSDLRPAGTSIPSRHSTPCPSAQFSPSEFKYSGSISSSSFSSPQSVFQVSRTMNDSLDLGEESKTIQKGCWRPYFQEQRKKQKLNRMSLDFILSAEPRYPSLPNIMPNSPRGHRLHTKGPRALRPRLPSLKEAVGYVLTQTYDDY